MSNNIVQKESARIRKAVEALRPHFRGKSDVDIVRQVLEGAPSGPAKVKAEQVAEYAKRRKRFSTGDVVEQFGVTPGSAAALVAILRIKEVIEPDGKANDNTSRWRHVG